MITEVKYGKTFNLGNYESERLDCTYQLEDGETPEAGMDRARQWVHMQYSKKQQVADLESQVNRLESRRLTAINHLGRLVKQHEQAAERYNELRALLAKHGVEIAALDQYSLPPKLDDLVPNQEEEEDDQDEDDEEAPW